jgi:hypothetical protein
MIKIKKFGYSNINSLLTVMLTVHNHEQSVQVVLDYLIKNITVSADIIIFLDNCNDKSAANIFLKLPNLLAKFNSVIILESNLDVYEVLAESEMWKLANTRFVISTQCDMCIYEYEFDKKLIYLMNKYTDLYAIGLRGGDSFDRIFDFASKHFCTDIIFGNPIIWLFKKIMKNYFVFNKNKSKENVNYLEFIDGDEQSKIIGFINGLPPLSIIDDLEYFEWQKRIYYVDSIMRGPIFYEKSKMKDLGFLNTSSFFQGLDDHEMNLRYKIYSEYKCAFYPIKCADTGASVMNRKRKFSNLIGTLIMAIRKSKNYKRNILLKSELINKYKSKIIKFTI